VLGGPVSDLLDAARKIQQQPNDAEVQRLLKQAVEAVTEAQRASEFLSR